MNPILVSIGSVLLVGVELLGMVTAVHAIMSSRTSQGAIAWAIILVIFPFISLPAYWIFGQNKFQGYIEARRYGDNVLHHMLREVGRDARQRGLVREDKQDPNHVLEKLVQLPFTKYNRAKLLVDGDVTFGAIFDGIDSAEEYIVLQFYIVRDDELGRELKRRLLMKAAAGVQIYFLYDEIGSYSLPGAYIRAFRDAGVDIRSFQSTKGFWNRFQLNFRNHRKVAVIDGRIAYVGGLNVGDEYMGRSTRFGPWRDTHVQIEGPAVHAVQLSFVEDWFWATNDLPELNWKLKAAENGDQDILVMPTGPTDRLETCGLFFIHLINSARRRVWIASPYFVPDVHVVCALQLAALRGVDVRIILPEKPDHILVYLSGFSFLDEADDAGVKVYRYQKGFLHHKVILVDDRLAGVGTANLDNRSFRLNFEITVLVDNEQFNKEVTEMLQNDFEQCRAVKADIFLEKPFLFRLASKVARLMSPVQ